MSRNLRLLSMLVSVVCVAGASAGDLPRKLFGPEVVKVREWVELPSTPMSLQVTGDLIAYEFAYLLVKTRPSETERQYRVIPGVEVSYPEATVKVDKHAPGRVVVTVWHRPQS